MARLGWPRWALQQLCVLLRARSGEQSVSVAMSTSTTALGEGGLEPSRDLR